MRNIGIPRDSIKQKEDAEQMAAFRFSGLSASLTASFCGQWASGGAALLALAHFGRTGWTRSCLADM